MTMDTTQHYKTDLFGRTIQPVKRNKLACAISPVLAVLFVSLSALLVGWILSMLNFVITGDEFNFMDDFDDTENPVLIGAGIAIFVSLVNFYLCFISIPIAWVVISQSVGRLVHRGVTRHWAYIRWMSIWGALLVGLTCTIPGFFTILEDFSGQSDGEGVGMLLGGLLMGALIGALAGCAVGTIYVLILRPESQFGVLDQSAADVFD